MAITETRSEPTTEVSPVGEIHENPWGQGDDYPSFVQSLGSSDHKTIGRFFIGSSLLFGVLALGLAALAALHQIADVDLLDADVVFQVLTLSRLGLAFLFAIPLLLGLAIYLVPLQVGAATIAFPRAAATSFWAWLLGATLLVISYAADGGIGGSRSDAIDLALLALGVIVMALLVGAVCVATTVVTLRAPGLRLDHVPMLSWSMLVASSMWLLSLPVFLANLLLVFLDHRLGRPSDFGVALNQWPQLEWAFQQPQVFVLAIPVLGIVGDIVPTLAGVRQQGRGVLFAAIGAFGILSFGAWAQPFFSDEVTTQWLYVGMGFAVLLPILGALAGWVPTLRDGSLRTNAPMAGALLAMIPLLLAGVGSALYVVSPLDLQTTEVPYAQWGVLALVVGAVTVAGIAGLAYWVPKIWGRQMSNGIGMLAVLCAFAGSLVAGIALVLGGFRNEASWVADLEDFLNGSAAAGLALLALGALLCLVGLLGRGGTAADDPWDGQTLEWATSSPPPLGNFAGLPQVVTAEPLLDLREPATAEVSR